jgi:hypothetical protein
MKITRRALDIVNAKYDGNVTFKSIDGNRFTLKVKDFKGPGHRLHTQYGFDGFIGQKRSSHACWHVHGDFFDALFTVNPDAVIRAGAKKITKDAGNWEDWNIGSQMAPIYYSESCEC